MFGLLRKIFGTQNERELRKFEPLVQKINELEKEFSKVSDSQIKERASKVRIELESKYKANESALEDVRQALIMSTSDTERNKHKKELKKIKNKIFDENLAEVFALVREASKRTIGLRHFDVQLMGGIVLHQGKIAEMATGEGKTLVATLAASLNAFSGESVFVITVNDYLAKRDAEWMGPIYQFLGLSIGVIQSGMQHEEKKKAYKCSIVYGTNNEFGFDYLRDNMVIDKDDLVQSYLGFAIVDEVDSILIDEARTPLIISGPVDETNEAYNEMRPIVQEIVRSQRKQVSDYIQELKKNLKEGKNEKAGELLYLVHKADPKNREFLDIVLGDRHAKTLLDKNQSLLESKMMEKERDTLLEALYYVYDEKERETIFSAKGQKLMRERFSIEFMLEDIEEELANLVDSELSPEEKAKKEQELMASYTKQQRQVESIKQLLKAYILFQKDVDYVVKDNKIVIVDSFTGRMMPGRRFSDGIHEAIEAKEHVEVQRESQTLATITLQNYFRMYDKLAGMTGTAKTEEAEFESIYQLNVVQVPTNRPLRRVNMPDRIYKTENEKFNAVINEIIEHNTKGSPVLVGTISIEKSERLSRLLNQKGVKHNVLNAKYHEREAHIVAQAGRFSAVTIATNMAGRGTDILLGGNAEYLAGEAVENLKVEDLEERKKVHERYLDEFKTNIQKEHETVVGLGGLHVIGTERHEARRIDNQLRGRSGRQGDAGSSRFYLSLEDDLMRIFGSDRIKMIMDKLGMEEGEVIENPLVTRAVRTAQHRVEIQNFEIRKHLLKYDNVMNQQREVIYKRRHMVLMEESLKDEFLKCLESSLEAYLGVLEELPEPAILSKQIIYRYAISIKPSLIENKEAKEIIELVKKIGEECYASREKFLGEKRIREIEKIIMLGIIDSNWKEYLREIDDLREGISWRAYAQKDPLIEFQYEAFSMFSNLMVKMDEEIAERIMKASLIEVEIQKSIFRPEVAKSEHREYSAIGMPTSGQDEVYDTDEGTRMHAPGPIEHPAPYKRDLPKVGRNDPCPCGSGKKYKKCCGR